MDYKYEKAFSKIIEAREKNLESLSLMGLKLNRLPKELFFLKNLELLNLESNSLEDIPQEIENLTSLNYLSLSDNQLARIPIELFELKELRVLKLDKNKIETLPREIRYLRKLQELSVNCNLLLEIPKELGLLQELNYIDLSNNEIIEIPQELSNLNELSTLDLSANKITDINREIFKLKNLANFFISGNSLKEIPQQIGNLKALKTLYLEDNPLKRLPKEIANLKNLEKLVVNWGYMEEKPPLEIIHRGIKSIQNYYKALKPEKTVDLFEAKLLIVGSGGVGKTYLMKRIVFDTINPNEVSTEGIDIKKWGIAHNSVDNFRINIWDFGGQEIYHATHQFFLTRRSLYLFVWDVRTDDNLLSFDYWLNVIKLLSNNSPVIVVMNKVDERIKSIDENSLQLKFQNIIGFHKVSALYGDGISELIRQIKNSIIKLEHVGNKLPQEWIQIRQELEKLNDNFISYNDYLKICKKYKLDEKKANFLSQYYHDLGVFLHFRENIILQDIIFLKPEWATNAVYKVIDTKDVIENNGKFYFDELRAIWDDYPRDSYKYLIELMKKFEIAFQLPNSNSFVIPELLPMRKPEFSWNDMDNLTFKYNYDFMPAGIITRLIVKLHELIKDNIYWKFGCIISIDNSQALIISDALRREITIKLNGLNKHGLLAIIRRDIQSIHQSLNNPNVQEMYPCICQECVEDATPYFYDYKKLQEALSKGKKKTECKNSFEDVSIQKILTGFEDSDKKIKEQIEEKLISLIRKDDNSEDEEKFKFEANKLFTLQPNLMGIGINLNYLIEKIFNNHGKKKTKKSQ